jgi:hypothetical protein
METVIPASSFMDRVLDPLASCLNSEAVESIRNLQIDFTIQERVAALAELANEGKLTPEERDEYLSYVEAADLLAIFKLKAEQHHSSKAGG